MQIQFNKNHYDEIAGILGAELEITESAAKFIVKNVEKNRQVILEIYPSVEYPEKKGNMLILHTATSHMQMHNCLGFVASEMLGEVAFISESEGNLSGVVVEKGAGITIYTNVNKDLLSADFTTLSPEVMMAGISLSLADHLLSD